MSVKLKIKSKHLALEPTIIRKELLKLDRAIKDYKTKHQFFTDNMGLMYKQHPDLYKLYCLRNDLDSHLRWNVCNEARATYLARAFIKQIPYRTVESKCKQPQKRNRYILPRVLAMVQKYHARKIEMTDIEAWINS